MTARAKQFIISLSSGLRLVKVIRLRGVALVKKHHYYAEARVLCFSLQMSNVKSLPARLARIFAGGVGAFMGVVSHKNELALISK